jgi:hypothetical protein
LIQILRVNGLNAAIQELARAKRQKLTARDRVQMTRNGIR